MTNNYRMRLFESIGAIDDSFIEEVEQYQFDYNQSANRKKALRYGTAGVMVTLAATAVFLGIRAGRKAA